MDLAAGDACEDPDAEQAEELAEDVNLDEVIDLEKLATHLALEKTVRPTGFVVSITRGVRCRRLHFAGGCWRIPGEHYGKFDDFGQVVPPESAYGHRCKDCFPVGIVAYAAEEAEPDASGSSGSSSSSSSAAGPDAEASDS